MAEDHVQEIEAHRSDRAEFVDHDRVELVHGVVGTDVGKMFPGLFRLIFVDRDAGKGRFDVQSLRVRDCRSANVEVGCSSAQENSVVAAIDSDLRGRGGGDAGWFVGCVCFARSLQGVHGAVVLGVPAEPTGVAAVIAVERLVQVRIGVLLAAVRARVACVRRSVGGRRGWDLRDTQAACQMGGEGLVGDLE